MTVDALLLSNLTISFGGLTAVSSVDLEFARATLTGLIVPNGAGKTTLLNAISGFVPVTAGQIMIGTYDLTGLSPAARAKLGVVRGFQTVRLLERESVFDNVLVGCERLPQPGLLEQLFATRRQSRARRRDLAATEGILRRLGLLPLAYRPVSELPFASRRLTEIARLLVVRPRVLLLDEPAAGLDTRDRHALTELLQDYHAAGDLTMIVIEHDVDLVRRLCPRCVALDMGRVIAIGSPAEVLDQPDVRRAYFGIAGHA